MAESTVTDIRGFLPAVAAPAPAKRGGPLRILFLVSAHNGLSQRVLIALTELGYQVAVAVVDSAAAMEAAVREHDPELIVCPFLKTLIPARIWSNHHCLVVHPGPRGDRGPSSLDWAIELRMREWGVTVVLANGEFDAGEVLSSRTFPMREAGKTSLYRHAVRHAAVGAMLQAIGLILEGAGGRDGHRAQPAPFGRARPLMTQTDRAIDWGADSTDAVMRKIRAGDGHPGVLDAIGGREFHLFGAHRERLLNGRPGELIARRHGAICRATVDGAVWITHLKRRDTPTARYFKLPATDALELAGVEAEVPESEIALDARLPAEHTYRELSYEEQAGVGYLRFDFYNGAMSTDQCRRLRAAFAHACARDTKVIVLLGGDDYFSNGIHLGVIEASEEPGAESWRNLNAIDDLVRDIVQTESHLVISALGGDAGAGGVPLALAGDYVIAREDIVLNPYYRHMGGLHGSEYWTYLLPRRIGAAWARRLTDPPFDPVGTNEALRIGLIDAVLAPSPDDVRTQVRRFAERVANDGLHQARLSTKQRRRVHDERVKPLHAYRTEELAQCLECFFGPDRSYHEARRRFIYKTAGDNTAREEPACLAI